MNTLELDTSTIRTGAAFPDRESAIRATGRILLEAGHVDEAYIEAMVERDRLSTVYVGNGIAVPHGTKDSRIHIRSTGIALVQVPFGVDFGNGNIARLLVGIAARGDEHMDILSHIALVCSDDDQLAAILAARDPAMLLSLVQGARP